MLSHRLTQAKSYLSVATFLIVALLASETHAKKHHSKTSKKTTEIISGSVGGAVVVGGTAALNKKKPKNEKSDWDVLRNSTQQELTQGQGVGFIDDDERIFM